MPAILEAVTRAGDAPVGMRPIDQLVWKFNATRDAMAVRLHEGQPTLTKMASSGIKITFPQQRVETLGEAGPFPVIQSSLTDPEGCRLQTAIGVADFELSEIDHEAERSKRLDQRLADGIAAHAAGLDCLIKQLAANTVERVDGKTARLSYRDLVPDNPNGLLLRATNVRDPRFSWAYIQVQTIYYLK